MTPLPKPILGEITAFTIATPDLERSLAFYIKLGYSELFRAEWPFPWIQISDGVVLIMLRQDPKPYIALTYYVKDIEKVVKDIESKGISFTQKAKPKDPVKRCLLHSPDGLNISLVGMMDGFKQPKGPGMLDIPQEDYFRPEKYVNKTCGLYGEFAHPVADMEASIGFWRLLGFEAVSKFTSPYPWAILSDGLSIVGVHQTAHFKYPAITYFAADMVGKVRRLKETGLKNYKDQGGGNYVFTTPEQQHIFLFSLGGAPAKKPAIDELKMTVLETERLLLKELSPEVLDVIFTSFSDEETKLFLGLTDEELETEKYNWRKGHTTYRISFKAFLLVEKFTGRIVGKSGFHSWFPQHFRAEIGYALKYDEDKGKGLMTEALTAIIDYGFKEMGLNRIEAMVGTHNVPSLKIMTHFGFEREGLLREHYCKNGVIEDSVVFGLLKPQTPKGA